MKINILIFLILFHFTNSIYGSSVGDFLNQLDAINNPEPSRTELMQMLAANLGAKIFYKEQFGLRVGCKCFAKNKNNDPNAYTDTPANRATIQSNSNQYINLIGDSMTEFINRDYIKNPIPGCDSDLTKFLPICRKQVEMPLSLYYGDNANNIKLWAIGGSATEHFRDHLDSCSNNQPNVFYPDVAPYGHVQMENNTGVILYGGNDMLRYELLLKALPWLTYFRMAGTINDLNRLVTYNQAQGANVILVSHTPRTVPPEFTFFGDLGDVGSYFQNILGPIGAALGTRISTSTAAFNDINACISAGVCQGHYTIDFVTSLFTYSGEREQAAESFIASLANFSGSKNPDRTWISQQLAQLSIFTYNLVALRRNVEWVNEWFQYSDPVALSSGKWWIGNRALYIEGDGIHFLHPWGHALHANNIKAKMNEKGWLTNSTPYYGDRCNALVGATFPTGQPANWTDEPPPLPAAGEDEIALILMCFLFKICKF